MWRQDEAGIYIDFRGTWMDSSFKQVPVSEDSYIQSTVEHPMLYLSFVTMNPIRNKYTVSGQF